MKRLVGLFGMALLGFGSSVFAENAAPEAMMGSSAMAQGLLLAAFAVIFYFLILRPQNKRAKDHQQLVLGLQKDDEVITTGGLLGKIVRVSDNFLVISIADGVEVLIQRQAIATSVPKGTAKSI